MSWDIVMRLFNRFRRLQWKLMLSYTLVTTVVMTGVSLVVMIVELQLLMPHFPQSLSSDVYPVLEAFVEETVHYLEAQSPDINGLQVWASRLASMETLAVRNMQGANSHLQGTIILPGIKQVTVLDADGNMLAAAPEGDEVSDRDSLPADANLVLDAALSGQQIAANLRYFNPQTGLTSVFLSVVGENGDIIGVVIVTLFIPPGQPGLLNILVPTLLITFVGLLLLSIIMGTLFGYLASRGLVRRLQVMGQATAAWAHGDFS
jgi:hypothetical protein